MELSDLIELPGGMTELPDRFWAKVRKGGEVRVESLGPCWEWTAYALKGYGRFRVRRETHYAHRLAYQEAHGGIEAGLLVDHMCRHPLCVNPDHLQSATRSANGQNRAGLDANNSSGYRGVGWHKQAQMWRAYANLNGRQVSLGLFRDAREAGLVAADFRRQNYENSLSDLVEEQGKRTRIGVPALEAESVWYKQSTGTGGNPGSLLLTVKEGRVATIDRLS